MGNINSERPWVISLSQPWRLYYLIVKQPLAVWIQLIVSCSKQTNLFGCRSCVPGPGTGPGVVVPPALRTPGLSALSSKGTLWQQRAALEEKLSWEQQDGQEGLRQPKCSVCWATAHNPPYQHSHQLFVRQTTRKKDQTQLIQSTCNQIIFISVSFVLYVWLIGWSLFWSLHWNK